MVSFSKERVHLLYQAIKETTNLSEKEFLKELRKDFDNVFKLKYFGRKGIKRAKEEYMLDLEKTYINGENNVLS